MNDPEVYQDPDVFRPERFIREGKLDTSVRDPAVFVFGYGQRHVAAEHPSFVYKRLTPGYPGSAPDATSPKLRCSLTSPACFTSSIFGRLSGTMVAPSRSHMSNQIPSFHACPCSCYRWLLLTSLLQLPRGLSLHYQAQVCGGRVVDTLLCGRGACRIKLKTSVSGR